MRITQGVMVNNYMKDLQESLSRLDTLNRQLSSGKQFELPSENPIGVANSMRLKKILSGNEQYVKNIAQARDWLENTESSLDRYSSIMLRVKELAVKGANGSLAQGDKQAVASEVAELRNELINIANTKMGDRYLFSGQKTDISPFKEDGTFTGDIKSIVREIGPGVRIEVNSRGDEMFSGALETLQAMSDYLGGNGPEGQNGAQVNGQAVESMDDILEALDGVINTNLQERARVGARVNRLDLAENRVEAEGIQTEKLLSENEDVDIAEVITRLKMEESVYTAALAIGSRIIQPTLVDFMSG